MVLPNPGIIIEQSRTALLITDLQNDFLSPGGAGFELLKDSLARNNTVENIEALLRAARDGEYPAPRQFSRHVDLDASAEALSSHVSQCRNPRTQPFF